jgi:hypothetical protein
VRHKIATRSQIFNTPNASSFSLFRPRDESAASVCARDAKLSWFPLPSLSDTFRADPRFELLLRHLKMAR